MVMVIEIVGECLPWRWCQCGFDVGMVGSNTDTHMHTHMNTHTCMHTSTDTLAHTSWVVHVSGHWHLLALATVAGA